jgi:primosomal protein N' (replication factor Y) (superfamily II helicase)
MNSTNPAKPDKCLYAGLIYAKSVDKSATDTNDKVVSVAFPIAVSGIYDYEIPDEFRGRILPGVPVYVELKNRMVWGVAVQIREASSFPRLKRVTEIKTDRWTDSDCSLIRLYEWIASYYQTDLGKIFKPLVKKGMAQARPKTIFVYQSLTGYSQAGFTSGQAKAFEKIKSAPGPMTSSQINDRWGISPHMLSVLCEKGALLKTSHTIVREPEEVSGEYGAPPAILSIEQKDAVEALCKEMSDPHRPCLLYGITGSGKTYVYIELVKKALGEGKGAIILVPEISLTPQTIRRFREALGPVMTVIHSRMSDGERRDGLAALVTGEKRVVIGVRSAILAPMENVGLIIVDEEHDGSYKQSDIDPRYQARDVAVMRAHFQKALVVLGSATPSFESYHNALVDKYRLVTLASRFGAARLPKVSIVDMCREHRENNWAILSRQLHRSISETLIDRRQVILLLNRRGFSALLLCKQCGHTHACPHCSVKLTYHKTGHDLQCHQCGYCEPAPERCPRCKGEQLLYKGTGIQKAEEYLKAEFPQARLIRMDQDTTRQKGAHLHILEKFARQEADILLGTQMVSKGLNFPGVALVGVLQADIGLHIPDFRASEKTFQLLAQVAGRAGREDSSGEVIIQTYVPEDPCILAAAGHDFIGFYTREIGGREGLGYPPAGKLIRIVVQGEAEAAVRPAIAAIAAAIARRAAPGVAVLGPAPAVFSRIKNKYRHCLLLKSGSMKALQSIAGYVRQIMARPPKGVKVIIDVDPVNML